MSSQPAQWRAPVPHKALDNLARHKVPTSAANERVAAEAAELDVIVAGIPAEATALTCDEWAVPLYIWMRGVVHAGRELDAIDYLLRHRHRVAAGEWAAVDLRAKLVASFGHEEHDNRALPIGLLDERAAQPHLAILDGDEADIVLAYHRSATGLTLSSTAQAVIAVGVNVALDMLFTPPRRGPTPAHPLAAIRNSGRSADRKVRLSDRLQEGGLEPIRARSLARMLAGTSRAYNDNQHVSSLLYCAATRFEIRSLPRVVVTRWAADAADLDPLDDESSRAHRRRLAHNVASRHCETFGIRHSDERRLSSPTFGQA